MQTTLYSDMNTGLREYEYMGDDTFRYIESDWSESGADEREIVGLMYARMRRTAGGGHESLALYSGLLEHALLRWRQRLGGMDVYRGVDLDEDEIDTYREKVGNTVDWAGFASTSTLRRVAERFGNVLFVIHTNDRPYIGDVAVIGREQEVLFGSGTCTFVIEGVTTDSRTGRTVIELTDFQCFPDYDAPLTLEEAREVVSDQLCEEFGQTEGLVLLDGPLGQERVADILDFDRGGGESWSRLIRLGEEAWRKDRARFEAEIGAAKAEAKRAARVNASLLIRAVRKLSSGLTERLIALGVDLEARSGNGETSLMIAGQHGHWRAVRLLLEAGANARAMQPGTDMTALHFAMLSGSVKTVRLLLSWDVDVNAEDWQGATPLWYGVLKEVTATVALLLKAGADPSRSFGGQTPLGLACWGGSVEIASLLLWAGADPRGPGTPALSLAIRWGRTALVRLLLMVVDVEEDRGGEDNTPLLTAVCWGSAEVIQVLLEAGADATRLHLSGFTLLHIAAGSGSVESTRAMLNAGIHPDDRGGCGLTPLQMVIPRAGENGVANCIWMLIEAGADWSKCARDGKSALMCASEHGEIDVVKHLLAAGASASSPDDHGRTPLWFAAERGHTEVVKELVAWGARLDEPDDEGRTPLYVAMESGNAEVVRIMLDAWGFSVAVSPRHAAAGPLRDSAPPGDGDTM
jgi:ankyrin repeat protein